MTKDCSLNSLKSTSSQHVLHKYCFECQYKKQKQKQLLYTTWCELVFFGEFNEQSLVILWVNWFKNESFWKRFTCTDKSTTDSIGSNEDDQNHTKSFKRQPTTGSLHNDQDIKSFQDNLEKKAKPSNLSSELNNHHDTSILGTLLHMINVN